MKFLKVKPAGSMVKPILIDYLATFIAESSPGVVNKISQTVDALNANGYIAQFYIVRWGGVRNQFEFIKKLILTKADILILRNSSIMPLLFPILIWKRLRGKKVIVDVPTPNTTLMRELRMREIGPLAMAVRIGLLVASFPWALYSANKVLQYAHESDYFSFGIQKKTQLIANGVDVASISMRDMTPAWPATDFVMIAAASLAPWHGFDRLIKGISDNQKSPFRRPGVTVRLIIVGDGECRKEWEKMTVELEVDHCVEFVGFKTGQDLACLFDRAHVAIASLGLFRKGLDMASDLKSREYTARGLPFIAAGKDIDFDPSPSFVFKADNSDVAINIESVIEWYTNISKNKELTSDVRRYALERLDFSKKIPQFLE